MSSPSHIVIVCSYLNVPGGYEKAIISTANLFAEKGHKVTLLILDYTSELYFPVDKRISIEQHNMNFGITPKGNTIKRKINLLGDIWKFRQVLKKLKPSILICTEYPFAVCAVLAGARKFSKIFSWEHHHYKAQQLNSFWRFLFIRTYKKLDAVICLNQDEKKFYLPINSRATVIPNFISPLPYAAKKKTDNNISLLTVTRFNFIKGIDLLMATAKSLLPPNPGLTWTVIGYGVQKDLFLDFIKKENLSKQLIYKPAEKPDINHEYQQASIFVMTSRNECFPLVLLEAMNNAVPCVAFDCETGPRNIIQQGKTGLLVPNENVEALSSAILELVNDKDKREMMAGNAIEAIRSFYPEPVYAIWEKLFYYQPCSSVDPV